MDSRSKKYRPQIIYNLFDEPYVVVCRECYREYHGDEPEVTWMDVRIEAERARQSCPACQICGVSFPGEPTRGDTV